MSDFTYHVDTGVSGVEVPSTEPSGYVDTFKRLAVGAAAASKVTGNKPREWPQTFVRVVKTSIADTEKAVVSVLIDDAKTAETSAFWLYYKANKDALKTNGCVVSVYRRKKAADEPLQQHTEPTRYNATVWSEPTDQDRARSVKNSAPPVFKR